MIDRNVPGVIQVEWWFDFLKYNKKYQCVGMTEKRLEKCKDAIIMDKRIRDEMNRHQSMNKWNPAMAEMNMDKEVFDHWIGNFVSICRQILVEQGVLKV